MKNYLVLVMVMVIFLMAGCEIPTASGRLIPYGGPPRREWTFIVYMAADNDLEAAAIADFNELESVPWADAPATVLVLFDRGPGYDTSNGDWTDTRLFEVLPDPNGANGSIISKRIAFPQWGITADGITELDMSNPMVLENLISFAKQSYPADNYGLIIWGHGTGWRGTEGETASPVEPLKAVAVDGPNYMTISALGGAVAGKGLKVIAFDTCYGALMEIAYQLKGSAEWLVASEGAIPSTGWDYKALFSSFLSNADRGSSSFCDSAVDQFKNQYRGTVGTTISKISLSSAIVDSLFDSVEAFSGLIAGNITTAAKRNAVESAILNDVETYHFASYPSDLYMDLYSFADKMIDIKTTLSDNAAIQDQIAASANTLKSRIDQTVERTWSKKAGESAGSEIRKNIGVYVIPLDGPTSPAASHSDAYKNGASGYDKSAFVESSEHWVPHLVPESGSLLDKLFYWTTW